MKENWTELIKLCFNEEHFYKLVNFISSIFKYKKNTDKPTADY